MESCPTTNSFVEKFLDSSFSMLFVYCASVYNRGIAGKKMKETMKEEKD
jgi:hypothetical protein